MKDWRSADEAEGWVLAQGVVEWVDLEAAERARGLADALAALETRYAALSEEIEIAREEGRAAGFAEGMSNAAAMVSALRASRSVSVARAAEASLMAAELLLGEQLREDGARCRTLVERAMAVSGSRITRRVLVSSELVESLRAMLPDVLVEVGVGLGVGDVVLEFDDGQQVQTLAGLLAHLLDDVVLHVGGDE